MITSLCLPEITWHTHSSDALSLLDGSKIESCSPSKEGEIWTIQGSDARRYVLKRWRLMNSCNAVQQYRLLQRCRLGGIPVPAPVAAGHDSVGRQVLVTEYMGVPVQHMTPVLAEEAAHRLASVHDVSVSLFHDVLAGNDSAPSRPQHQTWYRRLHEEPDLDRIVHALLVPEPDVRHLIHGDFHAGNLVVDGKELVLLDWSEAGLGDPLYDFAWAEVLMLIYNGDAAGRAFARTYCRERESRVNSESLNTYEILAGIRWLWLCRTAPVPIEVEKIIAATEFVRDRLPIGLRPVLNTLGPHRFEGTDLMFQECE